MIAFPINTTANGFTELANSAADAIYRKQIREIQQGLNKSGLHWAHAYAYPGDNYYAYVEANDSLEIRQFYDYSIELDEIEPSSNSYKYSDCAAGLKELTVAEYMVQGGGYKG